jgi:GR25 family glycosyltransferase involved in LPS biosynthesis
LKNFKTYVLSLVKDVERRSHMLSIKNKIGLDFEFYDAKEPKDVTPEIENRYFKNTDFKDWEIDAYAAMATFLSHMSLLKLSTDTNNNILVIEDDVDINQEFDFDNIDFNKFDLFNIGTKFGCYAYFVTPNGARKILNHFDNISITQAYDWELSKIKNLRFQFVETPVFIQIENKFKSNISPNGYKKRKIH